MILIPSIDLRGGRCVRLRGGDFATQKAYDVEPAALLRRYHALGARWLHIVDLDGAKDGVPVNFPLIASLARQYSMRLQVGGGVRSAAAIEALLSVGVARVVIGSAAVQKCAEVASWLKCFGPERICLAFDVRIGPMHQPQVHSDAWTRNSVVSLWDAVNVFPPGILKHVLSTDIERDGTLRGPNFSLYRAAKRYFPSLDWQASGGIRQASDLTALAEIGVAAAVSGTALLEGHMPARGLEPFLPDRTELTSAAPAQPAGC
jgi:phosphoribosylformimino-5-aminoimidazole carboxamide ribotide isomerase